MISGLLELGHIGEAVAFIAQDDAGGTLSGGTGSTGIQDLEVAALLLVAKARARELGVRLDVESDSELPPIPSGPVAEVFRNDLLTVIGNLLDNSVEACQDGGFVSVSIGEDRSGPGDSALVITVVDDGVGIPVERREQVFVPGYSSKAALSGRPATGRGIGLTLVKRIAHRYGGSVTISNGHGSGVRVCVRLPLSIDRP